MATRMLATMMMTRSFGEIDAERLPVLDNAKGRKLLGSVSKRDLLVAYREASLAQVKRDGGASGARGRRV